MSRQGRKIAAAIILLGVALPSGLCSGFFTVMGAGSLFERDALARSLGPFILTCATAGWVFCILMIVLWRRLRRDRRDAGVPGGTG
jgi:hypothetical protein